MDDMVAIVGVLSVPIILIGLICLIHPIARIKIPNRARAGAVLTTGIAIFAIAASIPIGPQKLSDEVKPDVAVSPVSTKQGAKGLNRAKWNPLTDTQANALNLKIVAMEKCLGRDKGAACVEVDAAKIGGGCGDYARLMAADARGETANEERAGYLEAQCMRDMQELNDHRSGFSSDNTILLSNAAGNVRACLQGSLSACQSVERGNVVGFCGSYANEISSAARGRTPNDNLRGFYKAGCERDLLEVGA